MTKRLIVKDEKGKVYYEGLAGSESEVALVKRIFEYLSKRLGKKFVVEERPE